jgi:hypothetical protein
MPRKIFDVLVRAIDSHRLVLVFDEVGPRVIEPYLIFESSEGDMLLHGWQRSGVFRSHPPPKWCNLHVEDLASVEVLTDRFARPHHDYNPRSAQFHRVIYELPLQPRSNHSTTSRVQRERRRPPHGRAVIRTRMRRHG